MRLCFCCLCVPTGPCTAEAALLPLMAAADAMRSVSSRASGKIIDIKTERDAEMFARLEKQATRAERVGADGDESAGSGGARRGSYSAVSALRSLPHIWPTYPASSLLHLAAFSVPHATKPQRHSLTVPLATTSVPHR